MREELAKLTFLSLSVFHGFTEYMIGYNAVVLHVSKTRIVCSLILFIIICLKTTWNLCIRCGRGESSSDQVEKHFDVLKAVNLPQHLGTIFQNTLD